jgi:hypothetical protein
MALIDCIFNVASAVRFHGWLAGQGKPDLARNFLGDAPLQRKEEPPMPRYYFASMDRDGVTPPERTYEFANDFEATEEARKALAEMALDGLPQAPMNMLAVEVFDEQRRPIIEVRLTLETIPKLSADPQNM